MGKVQEKAEEIFRREHPGAHWSIPWGHRPKLSDLWPCDQEEYVKRAERELGLN
jgi:hypothetical protein